MYVTSVAFHYQAAVRVTSVEPKVGQLGGGTLVRVLGSGFVPSMTALVRVGSQPLVVARVLSSVLLECTMPSRTEPGLLAVEATLNEQDFSYDEVLFEYQADARVLEVSPAKGPSAGGGFVNVTGSGFSQRSFLLSYMFVRFNQTRVPVVWVSSTEVHCVAPEHATGLVHVELTLNDQQYTGDMVSFEYQDVVAHSIEPLNGPVEGGTLVVVRGANFHAPGSRGLFCKFVGADVVAASYEGEEAVRCFTPSASSAGLTAVHLINNDAVYVTSVAFHYQAAPRIFRIIPEVAPTQGSTLVDVYGSSFPVAFFAFCRFSLASALDAAVVPAVVLSSHHLKCVTPRLPSPEVYVVEVTFNGQDFSTSEPRLQATRPVRLVAVAPSGGPSHGGTVVHVLGEYFDERAFILGLVRCRFNATQVSAHFVRPSELTCVAPQHHPVGPVTVELTTDGQTFTTFGLQYTYRAVALRSLQPAHGPFSGGTLITLQGSFFDAPQWSGIWCTFNDSTLVPASFLSPSEVACVTPPAASASLSASPGRAAAPVTVSLRGNGADVPSALPFVYQPDAQIDSVFPVAGPVRGGTVLTLTGRRLWHAVELSCRFGGLEVPMLRLTPSRMQCVSPAAPHAVSVAVRVSANGQDFFLTGSDFLYQEEPHIHSLSPAQGGVEGGARVWLIGTGFSLRSSQLGYLHCRFNHTLVAPSSVATEALLCVAPPHPIGFASVEVTNNQQQFSDTGALFEYRSQLLAFMRPAHGPVRGGTRIVVQTRSLQPAPPLRCVFGDDAVTAATYLGTSQFVCVSPPRALTGTRQLRLVNGGTEMRSSLPFRYEEEDELLGLQPGWGPRAGGTLVDVYGAGLRDSPYLWCRFAAVHLHNGTGAGDCRDAGDCRVVPARWHAPTLVQCQTPVAFSGAWSLAISRNGQQFSAAALPYVFVEPIRITDVEPIKGPVAGGTSVFLRGSGMSAPVGYDPPMLRCRFDTAEVQAEVLGKNEWHCITPPLSAGFKSLEVTSNNADYTSQGRQFEFEVVELFSTYPINAPCEGGTVVTLSGFNFQPAYRSNPLYCAWGDLAQTPAEFTSTSAVTCETPDLSGECADVSLSLMMGAVSIGDVLFQFYESPRVTGLYPLMGPVDGGTTVTVDGRNLYSDTKCRFGDTLVQTAVIYSTTRLACVAPRQNATGLYAVELTSNERDFTSDGHRFEYVTPITLEALTPATGPSDGGSFVVVQGAHFSERAASLAYLTCRFNATVVPAIYISSSEVACQAPEMAPGLVPVSVSNNNADYLAFGPLFTYVAVRILVAMPSEGPVAGGTVVVLQGTDFVDREQLYCSFGGYRQHATYVASDMLRCVAPPSLEPSGSSVALTITSHEAEVHSTIVYHYLPKPILVTAFPRVGPVRGGTLITLEGVGFVNSANALCHFDAGIATRAIYHSPTRLQCVSPVARATCVDAAGCHQLAGQTDLSDWTTAPRQVSIFYDGSAPPPGDEDAVAFHYQTQPRLHKLLPERGPVDGGSALRLLGFDFSNRSAQLGYTRCRFNLTVVHASYVDDGELRCAAPPERVGRVALEMTDNLVDWCATRATHSAPLTPKAIASSRRTCHHSHQRLCCAVPFAGRATASHSSTACLGSSRSNLATAPCTAVRPASSHPLARDWLAGWHLI